MKLISTNNGVIMIHNNITYSQIKYFKINDISKIIKISIKYNYISYASLDYIEIPNKYDESKGEYDRSSLEWAYSILFPRGWIYRKYFDIGYISLDYGLKLTPNFKILSIKYYLNDPETIITYDTKDSLLLSYFMDMKMGWALTNENELNIYDSRNDVIASSSSYNISKEYKLTESIYNNNKIRLIENPFLGGIVDTCKINNELLVDYFYYDQININLDCLNKDDPDWFK